MLSLFSALDSSRYLRTSRWLSYGSTCLCVALFLWAGTAQSTTLGSALRQASFTNAFGGMWGSLPALSHGYLLSFSRKATDTRPHRFVITSVQTGKRQTVQLALKQPYSFVEDASMSSSGHILAAGSYLNSTSGSTATNFLADIDPSGTASFSLNLGNYAPERVCGAPDGSIWTLGQDWSLETNPSAGDYAMLRSYTAAGVAQHSYFSRSTLGSTTPVNFHNAEPRVTPAFLSCGDTSVGAYIGLPGTGSGYWVEVETSTGELKTWKTPIVSHAKINRLALLAPGVVYASVRTEAGEQLLYSLNLPAMKSASWKLVPSASTSVPFGGLIGRDGDQLVYVAANRAAGNPVLYWSKPTP